MRDIEYLINRIYNGYTYIPKYLFDNIAVDTSMYIISPCGIEECFRGYRFDYMWGVW